MGGSPPFSGGLARKTHQSRALRTASKGGSPKTSPTLRASHGFKGGARPKAPPHSVRTAGGLAQKLPQLPRGSHVFEGGVAQKLPPPTSNCFSLKLSKLLSLEVYSVFLLPPAHSGDPPTTYIDDDPRRSYSIQFCPDTQHQHSIPLLMLHD